MSQGTGQPKFELLTESEIGFFIKEFSALFIFLRGQSGAVGANDHSPGWAYHPSKKNQVNLMGC
jgi:hypothetical protein